MSRSTNSDVLERVAGRVLEDAAFIFTDKLEADERPDTEGWNPRGASLTFSGSPSGELRMWASEGFSRYAAANMLGVDEDSEGAQEKGMDALKELLNMVVGNYLTERFGQEPVFKLGLPEMVDEERFAEDVINADAVWLAAEDNPIMFVVSFAGKENG